MFQMINKINNMTMLNLAGNALFDNENSLQINRLELVLIRTSKNFIFFICKQNKCKKNAIIHHKQFRRHEKVQVKQLKFVLIRLEQCVLDSVITI